MRNEDWEMEFEDSLREEAYLNAEKDWEYQCWMEEKELVRREAKIVIRKGEQVILDHDRIETDTLAF